MTTINSAVPVITYQPINQPVKTDAVIPGSQSAPGGAESVEELLGQLAESVDEAIETLKLADQIDAGAEDLGVSGEANDTGTEVSEYEGNGQSGHERDEAEDEHETRAAAEDEGGDNDTATSARLAMTTDALKPAVENLRTATEKGIQALSAATGKPVRGTALPEYDIQNMVDALKRSPDLFLMMLSNELTTLIDGVLEGCLQRQQERNAVMADLNAVMAELRKLAKEYPGDKQIPAGKLEEILISLHPSSPLRTDPALQQQVLARVEAAQQDWAAIEAECLNDPTVKSWEKTYAPCRVYVDSDGRTHFQALPGSPYYPQGKWGNGVDDQYCGWIDTKHKSAAASAWTKHASAAEASEKEQRASLADVLVAYGIYAKDKLPTSGELVDVAVENITAKVNTMSSEQQLQMLTIQKFMNGRNEAFSMSSNVNKSSADNRGTIVGNLRG
ncbi:hypothetical protein [Pandoraea commovens]|uniref:Uncharacterized protein n=1 Tax=Pandoraea commovens TaxID=2508289 RepID=A0A5E4W5K1_9BURK|nr:hypothetical protein [Pandoraea commovens]VVE19908.1 hypothetical protein PCO31010_03102 [Pandoraea commovens]